MSKKQYVKKTVFMELLEMQEHNARFWAAGMMIEIAEVLYQRMVKAGLNQTDVAKIMGVNRAVVSRFFSANENSSIHMIARVAMAVGMSKPVITLRNERQPRRTAK